MLQELASIGVFAFLLVFSRVAAVIMMMPGIGEASVSPPIRMGLALAVSVVITPIVIELLPGVPGSPVAAALVIGHEIIIGLLIGTAIRLLLSALHVAGGIIAIQSSLGVAQFFDPAQGQQGAIIGSFLGILGLVLIFATNTHQMLFRAIYDSYALMPPTRAIPIADFSRIGMDFVSRSFLLGMQMASPFIVYGLVYNMGLGLLQRLMPQLQLFFIAMPLQIMMALFVLMAVLGGIMTWYLDHFESSLSIFLAP